MEIPLLDTNCIQIRYEVKVLAQILDKVLIEVVFYFALYCLLEVDLLLFESAVPNFPLTRKTHNFCLRSQIRNVQS